MKPSLIERDVRTWDEIGEHRTGSPGDAATSEWLAQQILAAGVTPEIDRFPFVRRAPGCCSASDGARRTDGLPLFDGGTTPDQGVTGRAGPLGSDAPIGVTLFGPSPRHPASRALDAARHESAHNAIIAIAAGDEVVPGLAVQNAESYAAPFGPPVLQVGTDAATWLLAAAADQTDLSVHAELTEQETFAENVRCVIEGRHRDLPPLVVMTPKSAWWTCTAERAGGITLWLNMIRQFASDRPERTVIFTANTGHELGHIGLKHYLKENGSLLSAASAWIHLGANFAARDAPVLYQASNGDLMAEGLAALRSQDITAIDTTPVGERPLGEARNVHDGGGSYISLIGGNRWFHHPEDRWPESVDLDKLERVNTALLVMAVRLSRA